MVLQSVEHDRCPYQFMSVLVITVPPRCVGSNNFLQVQLLNRLLHSHSRNSWLVLSLIGLVNVVPSSRLKTR